MAKKASVDLARASAKPSQTVTEEIEQIWVVSKLKPVTTGGAEGHPTAVFETNSAHPGGQCLVAGPLPVLVGKTPSIIAAIKDDKIREVTEGTAERIQGQYHEKRRAARHEAALASVDTAALASLPPGVAALLAGVPGVAAALGMALPAGVGPQTTSMPNDLGGGELKSPPDASQTATSPTSPPSSEQQKEELVVDDEEDDDTAEDDADDDTADDDEDEEDALQPVNPNSMSKPDLLAEAARRGVTSVNEGMTKVEIADEINANLPNDEE